MHQEIARARAAYGSLDWSGRRHLVAYNLILPMGHAIHSRDLDILIQSWRLAAQLHSISKATTSLAATFGWSHNTTHSYGTGWGQQSLTCSQPPRANAWSLQERHGSPWAHPTDGWSWPQGTTFSRSWSNHTESLGQRQSPSLREHHLHGSQANTSTSASFDTHGDRCESSQPEVKI